MKIKPGMYISFIYNEQRLEGFVLTADNTINIKLPSGYNIVVDKKSIKNVKEKRIPPKKKSTEDIHVPKSPRLKNVTILHTGGTIASMVDYATGAVVAKFSAKELIKMFPKLSSYINVESRLLRNMMSENMRFAHYNIIAREVSEEVKRGVSGIIITHGTDTMHYTATALSFMLKDISIPVVLVGSQRSSDRGSSDAELNLLYSAKFIAETDAKGVFVCMHNTISDTSCWILSGVNCRKMHSSRRDTFKPVNTEAIAEVTEKGVRWISEYQEPTGKFELKLFKQDIKVGIVKVHPNMFESEFSTFKKFDGLIIEGTGLGHAPVMAFDEFTKENSKILSAIKSLAKRMPVIMTTQTIYGRVDMNVYTPGRMLVKAGVEGNYLNMTPETAFIKLAFLLSNYKKEDVKRLFYKNLVGEITERSIK